MSAHTVSGAIGFLFGLIAGSFLNVCISRLPRHESIIRPSSHCPVCKSPIRWYDNVPVLSWILLRGRCRDCKATIPLRYPVVELATAIWFCIQAARFHTVLQFYVFGPSQESSPYAAFAVISNITITLAGVFLIGLLFMDWETGTLPDSFTLTGIALGIFLVCTQAIFLAPGQDQVLLTRNSPKLTSVGATTDPGNVFLTGPEALILGRVFAACGAALLLFLVRQTYKGIRHRDGVGLGDVKLLAMITAFLGFWPGMLSLFFGALGASVYGIYQIVRGRATGATKLAFGSFLCAGALLAAQVGDRIIETYSQLLR